MFFYPWYPAMMLALESNNVIDIRLRKLARGGAGSVAETQLMITEKVEAAFEAGALWMTGGQPAHIIDHYRKQVAENATRLAAT